MSTFRGRSAAVAPVDATQVAPVVVDDRSTVMRLDMELATSLAKSTIVPKAYRGGAANILVAMGLGRALGIEPIPSLYALHVIDGTPSPSATTQRALVRRAGHKFRVIESTAEKAVVEIVRWDDPDYPVRTTYTLDNARTAGLLDRWVERWVRGDDGRSRKDTWILPADAPEVHVIPADWDDAPQWARGLPIARRDNWWTNPTGMLMARATTTCVTQACSEVLSGIEFDDHAEAHTEAVEAPARVEPEEVDVPEPEVVDAEVVTEPADDHPSSPPPAPETSDTVDEPEIDEPEIDPRDEAKKVVREVRAAGRNSELVAQLDAVGIPRASTRWTEDQAATVIEIARGVLDGR